MLRIDVVTVCDIAVLEYNYNSVLYVMWYTSVFILITDTVCTIYVLLIMLIQLDMALLAYQSMRYSSDIHILPVRVVVTYCFVSR